jgi:hypothetical protein
MSDGQLVSEHSPLLLVFTFQKKTGKRVDVGSAKFSRPGFNTGASTICGVAEWSKAEMSTGRVGARYCA